MNGLTFPRYALPGDGNLYLSATHTRFGFKYAGTPLSNGMNVAAVLEWDFFDITSPNQMKLRFRQGYFTLAKNNHSLLFGQAWDLFSPLGPTTLMTNGYLWQTGNLGFRHAQVRYAYSAPHFDFAVSVNDPAGSGGWSAKMPVLQGRLVSSWGLITSTRSASRESTAVRTRPPPPWPSKTRSISPASGWTGTWPSSSACRSRANTPWAETWPTFPAARPGSPTPCSRNSRPKKLSAFWTELLLVKNKWSGWWGFAFEDLSDKDQLASRELKENRLLPDRIAIRCRLGSQFWFGGRDL